MTKTLVVCNLSFIVATLMQSLIAIEAFHFYQPGLKIPLSHLNVNQAKEGIQDFVDWEGNRRQLYEEDIKLYPVELNSRSTLYTTCSTPGVGEEDTSTNNGYKQMSRDQFFQAGCTGLVMAAVGLWCSFPDAGHAKLYSENAANLERINNGDFSGGAVFNNSPTTDRGKKRRAMTGCKVAMSREEASLAILKRKSVISEKECNTMVMDGNTEFMLEALRSLDCPTCANGIGRNN